MLLLHSASELKIMAHNWTPLQINVKLKFLSPKLNLWKRVTIQFKV